MGRIYYSIFFKGHWRALIGLYSITVVVAGLLGGITTVGARAAGASTELKAESVMTTALVQRINILDAVSTYSFFVLTIAVFVALFIISAMVSFYVSSCERTIHSLRTLGASKLKVHGIFFTTVFAAIIASLVGTVLLGVLAARAHIALLGLAGLRDLDSRSPPSVR